MEERKDQISNGGGQIKNNSKTSNSNKNSLSSVDIGRNDPCPCGSGKKYKKCCLDKDNRWKTPEEREAIKQEKIREHKEKTKRARKNNSVSLAAIATAIANQGRI